MNQINNSIFFKKKEEIETLNLVQLMTETSLKFNSQYGANKQTDAFEINILNKYYFC